MNTILFEKDQPMHAMNSGIPVSNSTKTEYVLSSAGLYIPKEKNIIETPRLIIPEHKTVILN